MIRVLLTNHVLSGAVDRFHRGIQREAAGRAHLELLAAGALAAAALTALRRPAAGARACGGGAGLRRGPAYGRSG